MDPAAQWGDMTMSVKWSPTHGSWIFDCLWGCFDFDFESEHEATEAFLSHTCRTEPCS